MREPLLKYKIITKKWIIVGFIFVKILELTPAVTSYSSENEAKNLQNSDVHLAQISDFEMGYLENHLAH